MRASLIIAAGGSSSRFLKEGKGQSAVLPELSSKVFYSLHGRPLLDYCVTAFQQLPEIRETVLAVPQGSEAIVEKMKKKYAWKKTQIVKGGSSRAESVWKALQKTDAANPWIMVHDGARPFITPSGIKKLIQAAKHSDGVILGTKVVPTIKEVDAQGNIQRTVNRMHLMEAQTPQVVKRSLLMQAYRMSGAFEATDEASLLEKLNAKLKVIDHAEWNPKITHYHDLQLAEAYLGKGSTAGQVKTGLGWDIHRLVKGRKFYLGGLRIPFEAGPLGHSDGDVLLHAVADALLGAAGLGDIGEWFSDKNPKYKNKPSAYFIEVVRQELQKKQIMIENIDTVIILERPKLGPWKDKIRKNMAKLLKMNLESISIKAKTKEGLGAEGRGEAVSAQAIATVRYV